MEHGKYIHMMELIPLSNVAARKRTNSILNLAKNWILNLSLEVRYRSAVESVNFDKKFNIADKVSFMNNYT